MPLLASSETALTTLRLHFPTTRTIKLQCWKVLVWESVAPPTATAWLHVKNPFTLSTLFYDPSATPISSHSNYSLLPIGSLYIVAQVSSTTSWENGLKCIPIIESQQLICVSQLCYSPNHARVRVAHAKHTLWMIKNLISHYFLLTHSIHIQDKYTFSFTFWIKDPLLSCGTNKPRRRTLWKSFTL